MTTRTTMLIMGAAIGYSAERIAPFLTSLRRTGYSGDVVLLVDRRLALRFRGDTLFAGVTLLPVPQWVPLRFGLLGKGRRRVLLPWWRGVTALLWKLAATRLAGYLLPPTEGRFLVFSEYLRNTSYERILLTDVRDVLFQRDPFPELPARGLAVSVESRALTVATEPHNAGWVRLAYGKAALRAIGSQPISCSGVTAGDRESMTRYLSLMAREILQLPLRAIGQSGIDQGIHNHLVWTGQAGEVHLLESLNSAVATLGAMGEGDIRLNAEGQLLNRDGGVIPVVHQYDRMPKIREGLLKAAGCGRAP